MSDIFVQLNTRSGMAFFYDAKLPEDALTNTPPGTIFIPIDRAANIDGEPFDYELTDWYLIKYIQGGIQKTTIICSENILDVLTKHLDATSLLSIDRLTKKDFDGTPFYIEIGEKDNDST